jgi:hypothetical protein
MPKKDKKAALLAKISSNVDAASASQNAAEPAPLTPSGGEKAAPPASLVASQPMRNQMLTAATEPLSGAESVANTAPNGKAVSFWLDAQDRAILHEFGMLLYSHGIRPTHTLIVRAALRLLPRDHRLVEMIRMLNKQDRRGGALRRTADGSDD